MAHTQDQREAASASFLSRWLLRPVTWFGGAVSALMILAIFAVIIYAIFMRYIMNNPLLWADEITGWSLVAIVMLGAAEAYRKGDHIAIDILSSKARGAVATSIAYFGDLAVLAFSIVVGTSTWEAIRFAQSFGSYTSGHVVIETWILQTPILIGAFLLGLTAIVRLIERLTGFAK